MLSVSNIFCTQKLCDRRNTNDLLGLRDQHTTTQEKFSDFCQMSCQTQTRNLWFCVAMLLAIPKVARFLINVVRIIHFDCCFNSIPAAPGSKRFLDFVKYLERVEIIILDY